MSNKTFIFTKESEVNEFLNFIESSFNEIDIVAFDLETDSVDETKAKIYGIGLAFQEDEGYYLPVRRNTGEEYFTKSTQDRVLSVVSKVLSSKRIIGHNLVYDILVWYFSTGEDHTKSIYSDTILMKHMVDEEQPFGLKDISVKYLGSWANKAQEALYENIKANGGKTTKAEMEMYKADTEVLGEYCAFDVILSYKLYNKFQGVLEKEGLLKLFYEDEVMPLYREVTIPMKKRGVQVDTELYKDLSIRAEDFIARMEQEIISDISEDIKLYEKEILDKEFPVKKSGNFPKAYARYCGINLDSVAKKVIEKLEPSNDLQTNFKEWMLGDCELNGDVSQVQRQMYFSKYPDDTSIFNLSSKHHLKWLFFDRYQEEPLSETEKGAPQVDDEFLESVKNRYPWVNKLRDLNTVQKMKSTYYDSILEKTDENGILRASFLQFGTTSGRFASRTPNLQNFVANQNTGTELDLFTNGVRKGITCRNGYKIIGADMESLEPHIAAYVSGDKDLQSIFVNNLDFYSAIAIKQFKLNNISAEKDADNYLGKIDKGLRVRTKVYALALFYGADKYRISQVLKCSIDEADELVQGYLDAFPGIKSFIENTHKQVKLTGMVKTIFGRIRHLHEAKRMYNYYTDALLDIRWAKKNGLLNERRIYKNLLNNSVNFQVQGTAGHVMNRAMLLTSKLLKENKIDGHIIMTIHDEQLVEVKEDQVNKAAEIIKYAMESAVNLDPIKLKAQPIIGNNYGECK